MSVLRDSSYYQLAFDEGFEKGFEIGKLEGKLEVKLKVLRRAIFRHGEKRLGTPDTSFRAAIEAIDDVERLERISDRILDAKNWNELIEDADVR